MAKSSISSSPNIPVILRFVENVERILTSCPVVLSTNILKHFGPHNDTLYLKGSILFKDSSSLDIAVFAKELNNAVSVIKYRYHYMDKNGVMIFRYDNAPHHHKLSSFPDHKHTENSAVPSSKHSIKDIINEISAIILNK